MPSYWSTQYGGSCSLPFHCETISVSEFGPALPGWM